MNFLDELANKYLTDKGSRHKGESKHGYALTYESYLSKWKTEPIRLLEVGICMENTDGGQSVQMWLEYFSSAHIYTFDLLDMTKNEVITQNPDRVSFFQGDQGRREDFEEMYRTFGEKPFDLIVEDGSHKHPHQMISLGALFKYVAPGGHYFLEDMSIPDKRVCCIRNDDTYRAMQNFRDTGKLISSHLTEDEIKFIETNTASIEIISDIQDAYSVAILQRKQK